METLAFIRKRKHHHVVTYRVQYLSPDADGIDAVHCDDVAHGKQIIQDMNATEVKLSSVLFEEVDRRRAEVSP